MQTSAQQVVMIAKKVDMASAIPMKLPVLRLVLQVEMTVTWVQAPSVLKRPK
jgi:hypothetical protein